MFGDTVKIKVIAANRENSTVDFEIINDKETEKINKSNVEIKINDRKNKYYNKNKKNKKKKNKKSKK